MTDVHPAANYAATPVRQKRLTWLLGAVALCALIAGAAAAVVIYALVDDEPAPSTVVVPIHATSPAEVAAAKAMDRYKNEGRTAVAISGERPVVSPAVGAGTIAKDEAATAAVTSSLAGTVDAHHQALLDQRKADAAVKADTMQELGAQP